MIPINALYSITLWKDVLFSYCLMFLCFLAMVMINKKGNVNYKFIILHGYFSFLAVAFLATVFFGVALIAVFLAGVFLVVGLAAGFFSTTFSALDAATFSAFFSCFGAVFSVFGSGRDFAASRGIHGLRFAILSRRRIRSFFIGIG